MPARTEFNSSVSIGLHLWRFLFHINFSRLLWRTPFTAILRRGQGEDFYAVSAGIFGGVNRHVGGDGRLAGGRVIRT
jgi:hypothetical protein